MYIRVMQCGLARVQQNQAAAVSLRILQQGLVCKLTFYYLACLYTDTLSLGSRHFTGRCMSVHRSVHPWERVSEIYHASKLFSVKLGLHYPAWFRFLTAGSHMSKSLPCKCRAFVDSVRQLHCRLTMAFRTCTPVRRSFVSSAA